MGTIISRGVNEERDALGIEYSNFKWNFVLENRRLVIEPSYCKHSLGGQHCCSKCENMIAVYAIRET